MTGKDDPYADSAGHGDESGADDEAPGAASESSPWGPLPGDATPPEHTTQVLESDDFGRPIMPEAIGNPFSVEDYDQAASAWRDQDDDDDTADAVDSSPFEHAPAAQHSPFAESSAIEHEVPPPWEFEPAGQGQPWQQPGGAQPWQQNGQQANASFGPGDAGQQQWQQPPQGFQGNGQPGGFAPAPPQQPWEQGRPDEPWGQPLGGQGGQPAPFADSPFQDEPPRHPWDTGSQPAIRDDPPRHPWDTGSQPAIRDDPADDVKASSGVTDAPDRAAGAPETRDPDAGGPREQPWSEPAPFGSDADDRPWASAPPSPFAPEPSGPGTGPQPAVPDHQWPPPSSFGEGAAGPGTGPMPAIPHEPQPWQQQPSFGEAPQGPWGAWPGQEQQQPPQPQQQHPQPQPTSRYDLSQFQQGYQPQHPQAPGEYVQQDYQGAPTGETPQVFHGQGFPGATQLPPSQPIPLTSDHLSPQALLRPRKQAPTSGWRRAVFKVSGGLIDPGESNKEVARQQMIQQIRTPVAGGHYRVAVLSLKGGVGKTTTSVGLGSTLATLRGDRIIAVDANPDRGTLAEKVRIETRANVRDLLANREMIARYADVRQYTSQATSRLEVLASDPDPAISEAFSEADYRSVTDVLEHYYSICITDCGTGLLHSAMRGILGLADQIVLVSSASVDGARSASATLDWLDAHDYSQLVQTGVVVMSAVRPQNKAVDLSRLEQHFSARCRALVRVPFDAHLEAGAEFVLEQLSEPTRDAYLQLAAAVAAGFQHPLAR
jgi:MinD-like ATPase involved in chromosome partitioning or flagellar assembly